MPLDGLMSRPPVSNATPLPISVIRVIGISPSQFDHARRAVFRCGGANSVNEREICADQRRSDNLRELGVMPLGKLADLLGQFSRPEIIGRRIDQVADTVDRPGRAPRAPEVNALRHDQARLRRRAGLVTGEAIIAEHPAKGSKFRVGQCRAELVVALRQDHRKLRADQAVGRHVEPPETEENASDRPPRIGDDCHGARGAIKSGGSRPACLDLGQRGEKAVEIVHRHGMDRDGDIGRFDQAFAQLGIP